MYELTFGIALASQRIARDWAKIERLLSNTLNSIFNQRDSNVHVIIVCHEIPDIIQIKDPRVTIQQAPFDIPHYRWEMEIDRMRKLEVVGAIHRDNGGGMMFVLDADDLVSAELSTRLKKAATKAVVIKNGYRLDVAQQTVQPMPRFWRKCGSCAAVRWEVGELPTSPMWSNSPVFHDYVEERHWKLPELFEKEGWSCSFLEEPMVMYAVNHGQNESDILSHESWKWKLKRLFTPSKAWSQALTASFGVKPADLSASGYSGGRGFGTERRTEAA